MKEKTLRLVDKFITTTICMIVFNALVILPGFAGDRLQRSSSNEVCERVLRNDSCIKSAKLDSHLHMSPKVA